MATVTAHYHLTGGGTDRPASHEREVIWSVDDRYEITAHIKAQKPSPASGVKGANAELEDDMTHRAAAAEAAQAGMGDMMAMAEAAEAKCGEDEACLQAELMRMASQIDPDEMQSARKNAEAATSNLPGPRYQQFFLGTQTGTLFVSEKAHEAYFDAACSQKHQTPCAYDTAVGGSGPLGDGAGSTEMPVNMVAEYDSVAGTLTMSLPSTHIGIVKRTVTSANPQIKTGTFEDRRDLDSLHFYDQQIVVKCGACKTASGTLTLQTADQLVSRPATVAVDWTFKRP